MRFEREKRRKRTPVCIIWCQYWLTRHCGPTGGTLPGYYNMSWLSHGKIQAGSMTSARDGAETRGERKRWRKGIVCSRAVCGGERMVTLLGCQLEAAPCYYTNPYCSVWERLATAMQSWSARFMFCGDHGGKQPVSTHWKWILIPHA